MKRLDFQTGLPFKRGDKTELDKIFWAYDTKILCKSGNFKEIWCSKDSFNVRNKNHRKAISKFSKSSNKNLKSKAKQLIKGAKQRGLATFSLEWLEKKLESGVCELSGLPFNLINSSQYSKNPYAPSLDRIDANDTEYSINNTRVVLSCINQALNQYGLEHFLKMAQAVIDYQKEKYHGRLQKIT